MSAPPRPTPTASITLCVIGLTLVLVATQSTTALVLLMFDGVPAVLMLVSAALAGTHLVPLLRLGPLPRRWHLLLGAGLGIGALATLVLALGMFGFLGRTLWIVIASVPVAAAIAAIPRLSAAEGDASSDDADGAFRGCDQRLSHDKSRAGFTRRQSKKAGETRPTEGPRPTTPQRMATPAFGWLWLLVAPFLATTLLVCVVPPGVLWVEEGAGYDVLEYHLNLPKEYLLNGEIAYTPHNVYGSFPANTEMLYLLSMVLRSDPFDGAATAKIVNALLGCLCVFAAYVAGGDRSRRVGIATGVAAAGVGWLTYLSGVAYVENGMLFFAFASAAMLLRGLRGAKTMTPIASRWLALAGVMCGLACGCKYSAVVLIAAPCAVVVLFGPWRSFGGRIRAVATFGFATLVGFAPWLIKNQVLTGNPVFPLAHSIFPANPEGWGDTEARHFELSHQPGPEESAWTQRLAALWTRVVADSDQRFGAIIFLLAFVRLFSRRRERTDVLLAAMLGVQILAWLTLTHLYARFAVPFMIPLVLLTGRAFEAGSTNRRRGVIVSAFVIGMLVNAFSVARLYGDHLYADGRKLPWEGAYGFFLAGAGGGHEHWSVINDPSFPANAHVLMVGDAKAFYAKPRVDYCVVFNRNPFAVAVRDLTDPADIVAWLRDQGFTHVLVNWAEISRLRKSRYGFPDEITPDLFENLARNGLRLTNVFSTGDPPRPYAALYRVPPAAQTVIRTVTPRSRM
jgi:hypothetical protein